MHYKVDVEVYHNYNIGDHITIYRAKFSKYVFEKDLRFTFM